MAKRKPPTEAFGLFELSPEPGGKSMPSQINALLKPYGLRLKIQRRMGRPSQGYDPEEKAMPVTCSAVVIAGRNEGRPIPVCDPRRLPPIPKEMLRNMVEAWGTFGINGTGPFKWVWLKDCSTEHLEAILATQHTSPEKRRFILGLLKSRD